MLRVQRFLETAQCEDRVGSLVPSPAYNPGRPPGRQIVDGTRFAELRSRNRCDRVLANGMIAATSE